MKFYARIPIVAALAALMLILMGGTASALTVPVPPVPVPVPPVTITIGGNGVSTPAQASSDNSAVSKDNNIVAKSSNEGQADVTTPAPVTGAAPVPSHVAQADVTANACVAAAILSGKALEGCGASTGGSSSPQALADSLTKVGVCARVALLDGTPVSQCSTPGSGTLATADAVADAVGAGQVCVVARQLDLAGIGDCSKADINSSTTAGNATGNGADTAATENLCLGLAVMTDSDVNRCTDAAIDTPTDPQGGGTGTAGNGTANAVPAALQTDATDGGSDSGIAGLPFTGSTPADLALLGLALAAIGYGAVRVAKARKARA